MGWPTSDGSGSDPESDDATSIGGHNSDLDDDEPAPPYLEDTVPRPFRQESFSSRNSASGQDPQGVSWASRIVNSGRGAAFLGARSTAASSRALPSEAALGPLTRSGQYYSITTLFKKFKVRKFYMCSVRLNL